MARSTSTILKLNRLTGKIKLQQAGEYHGRNVFEGSQKGIKRDMDDGMAGYKAGRKVRPVYKAYNLCKPLF